MLNLVEPVILLLCNLFNFNIHTIIAINYHYYTNSIASHTKPPVWSAIFYKTALIRFYQIRKQNFLLIFSEKDHSFSLVKLFRTTQLCYYIVLCICYYIQRSNSAPELHDGESMLQELGINIKKTFVPQKTTDSQPTLKHGSKKHHTSFEVLFDQDETKVSGSFLLSYTIN